MLQVALFGSFQVNTNSDTVRFETDSARALFAYLVHHPEIAHRRSALAALLWPDLDESNALANLRNTLSRVRKAIGDRAAAPPYLKVDRKSIRIHPEAEIRIDTRRFVRRIDGFRQHRHRRLAGCSRCSALLLEAAETYQGDFLAGLNIDSIPFEEWLRIEQERFRLLAGEVFARLSSYFFARQEYRSAIEFAHRQIALDSLQENAHRALMRALALDGQVTRAIRQFRDLRSLLAEELGVPPASKTVELLEAIREENTADLAPTVPANRLPRVFSSLFGREEEINQIVALLEHRDKYLVTIHGPGGIGKTRAAIAAGSRLVHAFRGGVAFLPLFTLGPEANEDRLVTMLSEEIGFSGPQNRDLKQSLWHFLQGQEHLIVMDNAEHLPEILPAFIQELIQSAPNCAVLATSQEPLYLRAEHVFPLGGLRTVPDENVPAAADEPAPAALALFRARAQEAGAQPIEGEEELAAALEICRLAGGNPLAIEQAAYQAVNLPVGQVLAAIQKTATTLASRFKDVPERQRSIRAVFEYAWEQLTEAEGNAFSRMAIFQGSFDVPAAAAVIGSPPAAAGAGRENEEAEELVFRLHAKSLLAARAGGRFSLHPFLQEFACAKLANDPSVERETKDRHAGYYVRTLAEKLPGMKGGAQQQVMSLIRQDHNNIRTALAHQAQELQYPEMGDALLCLYLAYEHLNWFLEGIDVFQSIADILAEQPEKAASRRMLARVLSYRGVFYRRVGQLEEAELLLAQSHGLIREEEDPFGYTFTLSSWGVLCEFMGRGKKGLEKARAGLALAREQPDPWLLAYCLACLGSVAEFVEDYPLAHEMYQESLAINFELQNLRGAAISLNNLGITVEMMGDLEEAARLYEHSEKLFRELDDRWGGVIVLGNLGDLALAAGDYSRAGAYYLEGLHESAAVHAITQGLVLSVKMTALLAQLGQRDEALGLFKALLRHPAATGKVLQDAEKVAETLEVNLPISRAPAGPEATLEALVRIAANSIAGIR